MRHLLQLIHDNPDLEVKFIVYDFEIMSYETEVTIDTASVQFYAISDEWYYRGDDESELQMQIDEAIEDGSIDPEEASNLKIKKAIFVRLGN